MKLLAVTTDHQKQLMSWFENQQQIIDWAGPDFRYPFEKDSFAQNLMLDARPSFALIADDSSMVAFGQYYQRLGKCHLARLVVKPSARGQGIVTKLLTRLCARGLKELALTDCSLFVMAHNNKAINAYLAAGFIIEPYPLTLPSEQCLYLVKT